jgi:hypothetical protein
MKTPVIPQTYDQWRHCIEVECGIPLEPNFIQARLSVLRDPANDETRRFASLYGQAHARSVLAWFEQAQTAVA